MILTSKGRYAVDSIDEMAKLSSGKRVPLSLIASNKEKSFSYLERILSQLRVLVVDIFF
jgi:DNA-binding IscR family transcriptional regulator